MNKEFIPYEQALELKELGFDEPCMAAYVLGQFYFKGDNYIYGSKDIPNINAPLYQQVVEWLRQKGIIIELIVDGWGDDNCVNEEYLCYRIFIWQIGKPKPHHNDDLGALATPQEAYSVAFDYILNIKNRFFDI